MVWRYFIWIIHWNRRTEWQTTYKLSDSNY